MLSIGIQTVLAYEQSSKCLNIKQLKTFLCKFELIFIKTCSFYTNETETKKQL